MGIAKKMEWLKWIRKYSTGILDTKTGSMETLIDSASSKTVNSNYAYASSVTADDECVISRSRSRRHDSTATKTTAAAAAVVPKQRPMLPPPVSSGESPPSTPTPPPQSLPNDDYDCYISLDGIPIKQEFQYTLSADTDGCGKITKHDIEGLASKILESMYGTTMKFSAPGRRTVKVTLNVRQSATDVVDGCRPVPPPSWGSHHQQQKTPQRGERRSKSDHHQKHRRPAAVDQPCTPPPVYVQGGSSASHRVKQGAQRYRRDQLVEMVSRSLAENLSFQNQRKSNKPESYHRTRTKRRPNADNTAVVPQPPPPSSTKPAAAKPSKVAWSPYDFEPVTHAPPTLHELKKQHQLLYGNVVGGGGGGGGPATVEEHVVKWLNQHAAATPPVKNGATTTTTTQEEEQQQNTKNNQQRYKRAKLASKKIHHHIHEHHHYHHYDYYIV
ncbi:protein naked cuticle homolog 1-like [Adelges cooleyi]|uniref:protein naked cuticle homolog 1-like n=1 Tax=Adelges cooleyi TaxID=133065 RepID=UPI002180511C|nr:protein naked cuticle homolog 1-like [Adelges cooleyi]